MAWPRLTTEESAKQFERRRDGLRLLLINPPIREWSYPIRLELDKFTVGRKAIFEALRAENLQVNVHYIPVHLHPYYRKRFGYEGGEYPISEGAYESLITLPLFHSMTDQDEKDVVAAVSKVTQHYAK